MSLNLSMGPPESLNWRPRPVFFFKQKTAYEFMPSLVGSEMCIRDRSLTMHATYQKVAVLSLIATVWIMSKGTDLLDDKI